MADLVKKIKIKKQDGTFTDYIPIGAEAKNVNLNNSYSVEEAIGNMNPNENGTIAEQLININKKQGEVYYIFPKNISSGNGGAGDCCIIKSKNKNIMIDCYTSSGWNNIEQMLIDNNITHLDCFILSHYHSDHMGNFVNLVENDYIDSNTKLYMPAYMDLIPVKVQNLYDTVHDCITSNNFIYEIPTENSTKELDENLFFTFYNTDTEWLNTNVTSDYNDASMCCFIKYGDTKLLFMGDAGTPIMTKMYENNFVTGSINLYKIEHHGINQDFDINFMEKIHPTYAYDPSSITNSILNNFSDCPTVRWLQENDVKIYATHSSQEYIIFKSSLDSVFPISGEINQGISSIDYEKIIYVDSSFTYGIHNGTEDYPYKDLTEAISEIENNNSSCHYTIKLADGIYNNAHPAAKKNRSHIININNITIESISEDATKVKLINGFYIENSYVVIKNVTIYNDHYSCVAGYNSNILLNGCTITNLDGYNIHSGITLQFGNLSIMNCTFYDLNVGISTYDVELRIHDTSFDTLNAAAIQGQRTKVIRNNLSFTNMNWRNYNLTNASIDITDLLERIEALESGSSSI